MEVSTSSVLLYDQTNNFLSQHYIRLIVLEEGSLFI